MSSSSSTHKHDQKLKSIVVAGEEKETMKIPEHRSPQAILSERTIIETLDFGLGAVQTERDTMKMHLLSKDNEVYICHYCMTGFPSHCCALEFHENIHQEKPELKKLEKKNIEFYQNIHWHERELEMLMKNIESRTCYKGCMIQPPYEDNTDLLFNLSSNDNRFGISFGLLESMGGSDKVNSSSVCLTLDVGAGIPDMHMTTITHDRIFNENTSYSYPSSYQPLSYDPVSSSVYLGLNGGAVTKMKSTMVPSLSPDHFLTEDASYPLSRDPLLSYNNSSYDLSNDINLDLTLGPSKSIGSINNNNIRYSSFNGEVTKGTTDPNLPGLPHVSMYPFAIGNSLDSVTRDIPPSPLQTTHLSNGMFSLQDNGASCSYSEAYSNSKGRNKVMEPGE